MINVRGLSAAAFAALALSACATKGYVRQQVETGVSAERAARVAADSQLTTNVNTLNSDMTTVKSDVATLKNDVSSLRTDLNSFRTEFGAKITAIENGMKFAVPVTFAFDDATVRDEDRAALDRFSQIVQKYYTGTVVTIEGHADPAGSARYNNALSKRRAESVAAYLAQAGMSGNDLRTIGYGETRQIVKGAEKDEPGAEANRRVVFVIESKGAVANVSSNPQ
jgi:outer membrane protein OmpA-like peptidoglycan-associated protein